MRHELRIMSPRGDDVFEWDDEKPGELTTAQEKFKIARGLGMLAYTVDDSAHGTVIRTFDPVADTIILTPALQGG